jgi:hypothetical protein
MLMQAFVIVLTSLLTSVLTLTAAWFVFDRYLKTRMWEEVDAKADEFGLLLKQRVSEGVREGMSNGLADLREKATRTATRGGIDMLEESLNLWFRGGRPKD